MSFSIDDILKKDTCSKKHLQSDEISNHAIDYCIKNRKTPQILERMVPESNQCYFEDRRYDHDIGNTFYQKPFNESEDVARIMRYQNCLEYQRIHFPHWRSSLEYPGKCLQSFMCLEIRFLLNSNSKMCVTDVQIFLPFFC